MDQFLTSSHNITRWIFLPILIFLLIRAFSGWMGKKPYEKTDRVVGGIVVGLAHLQLLVGLIIYFGFAPYFNMLKNNTAAVMKTAELRLYAVEHPLTMIIAIVLIQVGRSLSKKRSEAVAKHKAVAIFTGIAALLILSRMPNWSLPF
jgi:hypothetical protein